MRTWGLAVAMLACRPGASGSDVVDSDADSDAVVEADSDTAVPWTGEQGDGAFTRDTFPVVDDPIGPTALDGTWTGTFDFTEVQPLGLRDPQCAGTITLVIDGQAARHVVVDLTGGPWDPNTGVGPAYGLLTGIGFATLDPTNLTRFFVAASVGAPHMETSDLPRIKVVPADDHLIGTYDDVVGIGPLRSGHKLTFDAVRAAP